MAYKRISPMPVIEGGTGDITLTNHTVLVGAGTSAITQITAGTTGQVLTGVTGADPSFQAVSASGAVTTLHSQDGNNVTPTTGTINISGGNSLTTTGTSGPNTLTVSLTGVTQYNVQTGGASNALNNVAPSATSGVPLISQGATSQPIFGTAVVAGGGTGFVTAAVNGVLYGNTTSPLGVTAAGTTGQVLTATTGSAPGWASPAASSISITGDSGGALTGAAFTFTASGIGLSFAGSGSTETLGGILKLANGGTNANLTASNGGIFYSTATAGAILGGTATAQQMLQSGASTTPAWSTATWPATTTINQLLYSSSANVVGGVTAGNYGVLISSSAGVPSWLANGTTGQVLTATTSGTPSWAAAASGGITTINGDSGSVTGSTVTIYANNSALNCGSSVLFANSGTTSTLTVTDASNNTIIGKGAGKAGITGVSNVGIGDLTLSSLTSGNFNMAMGHNAVGQVTSGSGNVGIGYTALFGTSGSNNTAIGMQAMAQPSTSGSYLAVFGYQAGVNYTSSESHNILLNNPGTAAESNVLRIGNGTGTGTQQLNKAFIAGIQGITVTGTAVLVSSSDQLGIAVSSRKYKENIVDMGDVSSDVLKLRPVTFTLKDHEDQSIQFGLIAEEVAEIMPDLVVYDKSGDPQTVKYHELPAFVTQRTAEGIKTYFCS